MGENRADSGLCGTSKSTSKFRASIQPLGPLGVGPCDFVGSHGIFLVLIGGMNIPFDNAD
jgi:hypothetical protein